MIEECVKKIVKDFFNHSQVELVKGDCELLEKDKLGRCECIVYLEEGILFKNLDKNHCHYFPGISNTDANSCKLNMADYLLFQKKDDKWIVNIFEIKKTVSTDKWTLIKNQFRNAYVRSLGFKSMLGIEIESYNFITLFQHDKIKDYKPDSLTNLNDIKLKTFDKCNDWKNNYCEIEHVDGNYVRFSHLSHQLPEMQRGNITMFAGNLQL